MAFTLSETLLLAAVPLVGVASGVLASIATSARNVYISSITIERNKWIEKLRANIARFATAVPDLAFALLDRDDSDAWEKVADRRMIELMEITNVINLQLNPRGKIDENVLALINAISVPVEGDREVAMRAVGHLIKHSQWLLKAEWEKVKFEAHAWPYRWWHKGDYDEFIRKEYLPFASGVGSLEVILKELHEANESRRIRRTTTSLIHASASNPSEL